MATDLCSVVVVIAEASEAARPGVDLTDSRRVARTLVTRLDRDRCKFKKKAVDR